MVVIKFKDSCVLNHSFHAQYEIGRILKMYRDCFLNYG